MDVRIVYVCSIPFTIKVNDKMEKILSDVFGFEKERLNTNNNLMMKTALYIKG